MASFIRLNTIFIPSKELTDVSLHMAEKISHGRESLFKIDNQKYLPHLTIYAPEYPTKNIPEIITVLEEAVLNLAPVELEFDKFNDGWGYVGINFKKTAEIEDLHKKILDVLNPLREGHQRDKYAQEVAEGKYPPEQVQYINKYGYHNVLNSYHPHLSLARVKSEHEARKIVDSLNAKTTIQTSYVTKIGIAETGPNGTCTKIIKEFELS